MKLLALTCLTLCACIENPPLAFDPTLPPLQPTTLSPDPQLAPIARDQTFTIDFNHYLDPSPLNFFNAATLASAGVRSSVRAEYHMVDRRLILQTRRTLEPDLFYDLALNPQALTSITGQPYAGPPAFHFLVGPDLSPPPEPSLEPTWADIAPLFDACNTCHQDPKWHLPVLTRDGMVGVLSEQIPEFEIVRPYDAPRSYLMHKILWDYPLRQGTPQPPPWQPNAQPLPPEQLRLIERWIRNGAR